MDITERDYVTFTLIAHTLTVPVLKHLKRNNPFTGDMMFHNLNRVGDSRMFKLKDYVVGQGELQHLIDSGQIRPL